MNAITTKKLMAQSALGLITLSLLAAASAAQAQTPSHAYELNGSAIDTQGGPALTLGSGNTFSATGLNFVANSGISLSNVLTSPTYSIEMQFSLDKIDNYRKLIDFKNMAEDTGLYCTNGRLTFYNIATGADPIITAGTLFDVVLTHTAAGTLSGYVNGIQQFSVLDNTNLSTFTGPNAVAYFFQDDTFTKTEASAGYVDHIRTYDTALTSTQVAAMSGIIGAASAPEPASVALALTGVLGPLAGIAARRRRCANR